MNANSLLEAPSFRVGSHQFTGTTRNEEIPVWLRTLHTAREIGRSGYLDALGWSRGDPGGGALV